MYEPEYDEEKLKELILYICKKCEDDPSFDDEKLGMLLYLADMRSYVRSGESITGSTYIKVPEELNK